MTARLTRTGGTDVDPCEPEPLPDGDGRLRGEGDCAGDGQAVAVNLDIEPVEKPEHVLWVDPTHPHGGV